LNNRKKLSDRLSAVGNAGGKRLLLVDADNYINSPSALWIQLLVLLSVTCGKGVKSMFFIESLRVYLDVL